ncbi:hypothetical protein [Aeromonas rivipollensis]|uniref:hypothetical protein n=1 Tax=Aeromonas rivipollensis TaxID=948519 RepID=UPI0013D30449|nr:hypothetical protein [Aeromonas rivipollensis]NEX81055.1 hypothetical protein [Aeromonas rivipollensis]
MSAEPAWTIDELITRYDLEPSLKDVIVEGLFDQDILNRCFFKIGDTARICYPIDTINVPQDLLSKHNLTDGNKQRVIALSKELESSLSEIELGYRCLVDSDLDLWIAAKINAKNLVRTKYTSLDLYFFDESFLKYFFISVVKSKIINWSVFFNSFIDSLKSLYAIRLADHQLNTNLDWTSWSRCIVKEKSGLIKLDSQEYIKRVLNKNSKISELDAFLKAYNDWKGLLIKDPRLCIRGHDFIDLTSWVVGKFSANKSFTTPEAITTSLLLVAENAIDIIDELK